MKNLDIFNKEGKSSGQYQFTSDIESIPVRPDLYNDVVRYQLNKQRQGTADTKTRRDVRGGGAKPYRQKGTGRARAGTRRSPVWVGGGVVFGPHPRDYAIKLPKKVRKLALRSSIAQKLINNDIKVIDKIEYEKPSTRDFARMLKNLDISSKALVVLSEEEYGNDNIILSMRNIPAVEIISWTGLNLYSVLNCRTVLITKNALESVEKEILQ